MNLIHDILSKPLNFLKNLDPTEIYFYAFKYFITRKETKRIYFVLFDSMLAVHLCYYILYYNLHLILKSLSYLPQYWSLVPNFTSNKKKEMKKGEEEMKLSVYSIIYFSNKGI